MLIWLCDVFVNYCSSQADPRPRPKSWPFYVLLEYQLVPPENDDFLFGGGGGGVSSKFKWPLQKFKAPPQCPPTGKILATPLLLRSITKDDAITQVYNCVQLK